MKPGCLFEPVPSRVEMAPASRESWTRVLETLEDRQCAVLWAIYDALDDGVEDVTGGELAERVGWTPLQTRPRLTELHGLKVLTRSLHTRPSKAQGEARCHAYVAALPRSAVQRWREALKAK